MIYKIAIDAFWLTPAVAVAMEGARDHHHLAKSKVSILPGGLVRAIAYYADHPTPQVVVVEEGDDDATLLAHLGQLAEVVDPGTRVIVIGHLNDIGLYRTLLAQGVSEYLLAPATTGQILDAVLALYTDPAARPRGKLLAFFGVRGGVGSSVVAHNVADQIARVIDDSVVLVDLDVAFGTAALALNLDPRQSVADALAQPDRVDVQLIERVMVKHDDHLLVLAAPADLRAATAVDVDALDKVLDVAAQMAGFVVLDLPHLWSPWVAHVLGVADEVVLVATPDLACLRDAKALVDALGAKLRERTPIRLVLNRMDACKKTQLTDRDFEETLKMHPSLSIPFEPVLFGDAANNGQTLAEAAATHKVTESLAVLAKQLSGRQSAARRKEPAYRALLRKARLVK